MSAELLVFEYNGTARSGKNTIVTDIEARYDGVATEETGNDYRAVTVDLLAEGVIEPGMAEEVITKQVAAVDTDHLIDLVAHVDDVISTHGTDALHTVEVDSVVAAVSPVESLRKAVKAGFQKRVERVRDGGEHSILLVDGRNLAPVVQAVKGTELIMRTFVTCSAGEAARRELRREGLAIDTDEARAFIFAKEQNIAARNNQDARRVHDPVIPDIDPEPIDFWHDVWVLDATAQAYADAHFDYDYKEAMDNIDDPKEKEEGMKGTGIYRLGVGTMAVETGRQILFDTGAFFGRYLDSKEAMLLSADHMFHEALAAFERQNK